MDSLENIVARAQAVQERHQEIIDRVGNELDASTGTELRLQILRRGEGQLAELRRAYWWAEVGHNAPDLTSPAAIQGSTDPARAVIASVYFDIADTERRWATAGYQRTVVKRVADARSMRLTGLDLPDAPSLWPLVVVAIVVVAILALRR